MLLSMHHVPTIISTFNNVEWSPNPIDNSFPLCHNQNVEISCSNSAEIQDKQQTTISQCNYLIMTAPTLQYCDSKDPNLQICFNLCQSKPHIYNRRPTAIRMHFFSAINIFCHDNRLLWNKTRNQISQNKHLPTISEISYYCGGKPNYKKSKRSNYKSESKPKITSLHFTRVSKLNLFHIQQKDTQTLSITLELQEQNPPSKRSKISSQIQQSNADSDQTQQSFTDSDPNPTIRYSFLIQTLTDWNGPSIDLTKPYKSSHQGKRKETKMENPKSRNPINKTSNSRKCSNSRKMGERWRTHIQKRREKTDRDKEKEY